MNTGTSPLTADTIKKHTQHIQDQLTDRMRNGPPLRGEEHRLYEQNAVLLALLEVVEEIADEDADGVKAASKTSGGEGAYWYCHETSKSILDYVAKNYRVV